MNDRSTKRRGPLLWLAARPRRFWIAVVVLAPALYIASIGPLCWVDERNQLPAWSETPLRIFYWPILWLGEKGPQPIQDAIQCYADAAREIARRSSRSVPKT